MSVRGCGFSILWTIAISGIVFGAIFLIVGQIVLGAITSSIGVGALLWFWWFIKGQFILKSHQGPSSSKATKKLKKEPDLVELRQGKSWARKLKEMDGYEFEEFVANLFEEMGYETRVTKNQGIRGLT